MFKHRPVDGVDFADLHYPLDGGTYESLEAANEAGAPVIAYGLFINNVISFVIMALALFFVVKGINNMLHNLNMHKTLRLWIIPQPVFYQSTWVRSNQGGIMLAMVELDEKVAGFANFYQWQHNEFCALGNLMVAPWARSQGVAQHLVEVMEQIARERYKAPLMKVSCFNANAGGLLLYTRLGYQTVGIVERRAPDGSRVALVQLEKALP